LKKTLVVALILFLVFSLLIGCQSNEIKRLDSVQETNIEKLVEYKDSYVGDNSAVGGILYSLPGNMYVKQFSLQTNTKPYVIKVEYGLDENSNLKKEDFNEFWNDENAKNIFLNNAITLFILIKNVDEVEFNLNTLNKQSFRITRKELETLYGRDLREYSNDILAWKKEVIDSSEKIEEFLGE
jgi:hypothetical protein